MPDPVQPPGVRASHQPVAQAGETTLSPLDSRRFGLVVARNSQATCAHLNAMNVFCKEHLADLLIARCPVTDRQAVHCLEADGFRLMETLVYWRRGLTQKPVPARVYHDERRVRLLCDDDVSDVAAVARAAFTGYDGHYHADARLNPEACTDVYADWAANCCTQPGFADVVLGVDQGQHILGFMALKDVGEGTCDISLVAVAPVAQGRGIFGELLLAALHWMKEHDYALAEYSCVLTNLAAQAGLARAGFEVNRSLHTFHKWFDLDTH